MSQWLVKYAKLFSLNETLTRETRQQMMTRSWINFIVILILATFPFNVYDYIKAPGSTNLFFVINDLVMLMVLGGIFFANKYHHNKLAFLLLLSFSYYLCLTILPIRHPDQLLLNFTFPTIIASFVGRKESSIIFAGFACVGVIAFTLHFFPAEPFPYFSMLCLLLLAILASQVTRVLDELMNQVTSAYDKTIEGWSQALEMRNHETEGHSHRVADLAMQLVLRMKVNENLHAHIHRGVLLHDIGKMGVPDSILCKPGPLTEAENQVMRKHPENAYHLLEHIPYLRPALQIPYCHHEKWDGTGYPRGLKGEDIPLESRIFTVIDVWDAMSSNRSYRPAIPEPQVIEYLRCETGRSFDPTVIHAFFEMMDFKELEPSKVTVVLKNADPVKQM